MNIDDTLHLQDIHAAAHGRNKSDIIVPVVPGVSASASAAAAASAQADSRAYDAIT